MGLLFGCCVVSLGSTSRFVLRLFIRTYCNENTTSTTEKEIPDDIVQCVATVIQAAGGLNTGRLARHRFPYGAVHARVHGVHGLGGVSFFHC